MGVVVIGYWLVAALELVIAAVGVWLMLGETQRGDRALSWLGDAVREIVDAILSWRAGGRHVRYERRHVDRLTVS